MFTRITIGRQEKSCPPGGCHTQATAVAIAPSGQTDSPTPAPQPRQATAAMSSARVIYEIPAKFLDLARPGKQGGVSSGRPVTRTPDLYGVKQLDICVR